jgi:hypothetical protein
MGLESMRVASTRPCYSSPRRKMGKSDRAGSAPEIREALVGEIRKRRLHPDTTMAITSPFVTRP